MAGSDQSARLQGMLSQLAGTVGEMGAGRNWGANAIRQVARPDSLALIRGEEFSLDNSDNLMQMAQWAERNGRDDQASEYMGLAYKMKAMEGEKNYKTRIATDTEKLRAFNTSIGELESRLTMTDGAQGPDAVHMAGALEKVKDARRQHISAMNDFGAANDYGTGNEGSMAQRAYAAEVVAAEKAALEREETITKLRASSLELEDAVAKANPIDLSMIPPNLRDEYSRLSSAALAHPLGPAAGMRELNKRFAPISQSYLESLAKGDASTTAMLWGAVSNIRNSDAYGDDVKEYIRENSELVGKAIEQAEASLTGNSEYRTASPIKKQQMAEEALMKIIKGQQADFDDIATEEQADLEAEGRENTARAGYKDRDRKAQYKPGFEQGGEEYKKYLAKAKETLGEEFDQAEFDRNWDRKYFSPGGAIAPTSATGSVLRKGPY